MIHMKGTRYMTTSTPVPFLHEIENFLVIPPEKLAYFRARLQDRIYDLIVREFLRKEEAKEMTRSSLAQRIDKDPAQITRWLSNPGNWTLETISDFMLGVCAAELSIGIQPLSVIVRATKEIKHDTVVYDGQPSKKPEGTNKVARLDELLAA
jgi:hypothetical protein